MFGSDWPLVEMKSYAEAYQRAIPREHWPAVFHDNAVRVFRLERARGASRAQPSTPSGEPR